MIDMTEFIKKSHSYGSGNLISFTDSHGEDCTIQNSSSIEPSIWFGIDNVTPIYYKPNSTPVELPLHNDIKCWGRMHLTQDMVKEILPYLQYFAENGSLSIDLNKPTE